MGIDRCPEDALTQRLAESLRQDFGCPESRLDQGSRTIHRTPDGSTASTIEGRGDGCTTYAEAVNAAVEIATGASLLTCGGDTRLQRILETEHGIRIPWIFSRDDRGANPDKTGQAIVGREVERLRQMVIDAGARPGTADFNRKLARRLFDELMPFAQFRSGEIDPREGVWRLAAASTMAGLQTTFVALPIDPLGRPTPAHVALSIDLGDGQSLIADPAYEAFDLKGLPALQLDAAQALSLHAIHQAQREENPMPALALAKRLDPSNRYAELLEVEAEVGIRAGFHHPLELDRDASWLLLAMGRAEIDRIRSRQRR